MSEQTAVGRVVTLHSYPVKSMSAPDLDQVQVLPGGLEHDRGWAVVDSGGQVVTGRTAPRLRELSASPPAEAGQEPTISGGDPSGVVGQPVSLQAAEPHDGAFNEVAPVHLVSRQAVERAAAAEGFTLGDPSCSVEQPRANVVVELDGEALETGWVGREVTLGDVVLRISKQPKHCLGVYADVVRPGLLRVGDDVRLG